MKKEVRQPQQERSIEKKNRIIEAGYKLFSEVGYYGTNTAEIAKRAGVSTGIVYGYFRDKRDILISVLSIYIDKVLEPILDVFKELSSPVDYQALATAVLELTIKTHKKNGKIHEALHALSSSDEAVGAEFLSLEDQITYRIADALKEVGEEIEHPLEKIHYAMDIIQSFSHEVVFDKHEYIDYEYMKDCVIKTLVAIFGNN
ncbi:MAG: TetR/AcrR family transcriptional regulator [Clostridia bacterium]|nr:TetR/AcrR family transcriptional regulator [Clostridia bacterium]